VEGLGEGRLVAAGVQGAAGLVSPEEDVGGGGDGALGQEAQGQPARAQQGLAADGQSHGNPFPPSRVWPGWGGRAGCTGVQARVGGRRPTRKGSSDRYNRKMSRG
jgi:hypothetical protein